MNKPSLLPHALWIFALLAGLSLGVHMTSHSLPLPPARVEDLQAIWAVEHQEKGQVLQMLAQTTAALQAVEQQQQQLRAQVRRKEAKRAQAANELGLFQASGSGIEIELTDSSQLAQEGEDPNLYILHDQDLIHLLNDLKAAGAQALSVNGERLHTRSSIACSGATVTVNGKVYAAPFVLRAIGPIEALLEAVRAPGSYAVRLQSAYRIGVKTRPIEHLLLHQAIKKPTTYLKASW